MDTLEDLRLAHLAGEHEDTRRGDCPLCEEAFGEQHCEGCANDGGDLICAGWNPNRVYDGEAVCYCGHSFGAHEPYAEDEEEEPTYGGLTEADHAEINREFGEKVEDDGR